MPRRLANLTTDLIQDDKNATIYALCDPRTGTIRYVGKASDPARRYRRHLKDGRDGKTDHKSRWIASLLGAGVAPRLLVLEVCVEAIWKVRECHWIATLRAAGCDLTNCTDGGDGFAPLSETRAKMRAAKLGKVPHNKGQTTSPETRERQRQSAQRRWGQVDEDRRAEHGRAVRDSRVANGNPAGPRPGWHHTTESRQKIAAAGRRRAQKVVKSNS
jgi:hypothetical protein